MSARLTAYLEANTSRFQEGMRAASKSLTSFSTIAKATGSVKLFGAVFDAAVDALKFMTVEQFRNIDALAKQAQALGVNIAAFRAQTLVAREAGVSQEDLASAITKSQKAIVANDQALKALGLSQKELLKLTPDRQFDRIAAALSGVKNATEKTAITLEIFGRGAGKLVNMFDDYDRKVNEARAFNDKFGLSISRIDAAKVEEANDAWGRVKESIDGLGNTIAIKTAPAVTALSDAILQSGIDGKSFGAAVDSSMKLVAAGADIARAAIITLDVMISSTIIGIEKLVLAGSNGLSKLAGGAARIPWAGRAFTGISDSLKNSSATLELTIEQDKKHLSDLAHNVAGMKSTGAILDKIQADAQARADKKVEQNPITTGVQDAALSALKEQLAALERQKKLLRDIVGPGIDLQQTLSDLDTLYKSGKITAEQYTEALDKIRLKMAELDKTAGGGFKAGMLKVKQELEDVGNLSEKTVVDGFHKAEDAMVEFARTGKLSFKSMVDGIIADLIRLQVRQSVTLPLYQALDGLSRPSGLLGSFFSGLKLPSFAVGTDYVPRDMIAQIHKGERIVPAAQNGAFGGVEVTVNNNAGVNVGVQKTRNAAGGVDLKIQLDSAVAGILGDPSSRTGRMLKNTYGIGPNITTR